MRGRCVPCYGGLGLVVQYNSIRGDLQGRCRLLRCDLPLRSTIDGVLAMPIHCIVWVFMAKLRQMHLSRVHRWF